MATVEVERSFTIPLMPYGSTSLRAKLTIDTEDFRLDSTPDDPHPEEPEPEEMFERATDAVYGTLKARLTELHQAGVASDQDDLLKIIESL